MGNRLRNWSFFYMHGFIKVIFQVKINLNKLVVTLFYCCSGQSLQRYEGPKDEPVDHSFWRIWGWKDGKHQVCSEVSFHQKHTLNAASCFPSSLFPFLLVNLTVNYFSLKYFVCVFESLIFFSKDTIF